MSYNYFFGDESYLMAIGYSLKCKQYYESDSEGLAIE